MSSLMPFVALMSVQKNRRRRLLPLALPAVAGMPIAQAGALAIVTADSAARREGNVATAAATTAVTEVLVAAVANGADLTADDLKDIPLAQQVVAANPAILTRTAVRGASREDLERALAVIQAAMAEEDKGKPEEDSRPRAVERRAPKRAAKEAPKE